jgi:hypothetical protein
MPWTQFECPDGEKIEIEKCCEKGGCRMTERCVSRPTCILFSRSRREWRGKISATQALNGTRYEYLRLTVNYSEKPVDRAFALLGTFHHLRHQKLDLPDALVEERLEDEDSTGMFDYYEEENGVHVLTDYKTTAAYKLCRWLGKYQVEEETGEFFKSGPRAGQKKTRKVWAMREPDLFDLSMQFSRYAWLLRKNNFPVDIAKAQATIRDFNKRMGIQYGLDRKIYMLSVPLFDEETVTNFYRTKNNALNEALAKKELPPVCDRRERWTNDAGIDIRCTGYCPVWAACDHGRQVRAEPIPEEEVA